MGAAQRIRECQETSGKSLYLNQECLDEFPLEIASLRTHLAELNLSRNRLGALPPEVGTLGELVELELVECGLGALPAELGQLTKLKRLNLNGNALTEVPSCVRDLTELRELILDSNPLEELPEWIGELSALKRLSLLGTRVATLPAGVSRLKSLVEINLWRCKLSAFPAPVLEIKGLKKLVLGSNSIGTVPHGIAQLAALRVLDLSSAGLTEVPVELAQLAALKELDLGRNAITKLPPELANLAKLEDLKVYGNPITNLPKELLEGCEWEAIQEALRAQLSGTPATTEQSGRARYEEFIRAREFERLVGRRTEGWGFVLDFDDPDTLSERIARENDHFQDDLKADYPGFVPLALPALEAENASDVNPSELDEFLVVDTTTEAHPVLLWTHDGGFGRIARSFQDFMDGLEKAEEE
jgi:Leucine-rich repeat (LRR) protein